VLDVIEDEGLQQNAQRVGAHLRAGIEAIAKDRPLIGVLIGLEGPLGNALKIRPPPAFSVANADRLPDALDRALGTI
jgi:4-aminobutyrate aminotransferase-like enzyme